jgi:starch synthase
MKLSRQLLPCAGTTPGLDWVRRYEFLNGSPVLAGQWKFETEYDWGGTRIVVTTAMVEDLRVWFIEPRNGFFNTQSVYGRYDDEVGCCAAR